MAENEDVSDATSSVLLIHLRWSVADADAAPLNEPMLSRLRSYIPRYAETLSARCLIVGGIHDHLHLLLDLPISKSLQEVEDELRRASQRFLRDVLGNNLFLWSVTGRTYSSISPQEQEAVVQYIQTQAERHTSEDIWDNLETGFSEPEPSGTETMPRPDDSLPEWLRSAMSPPTK